VKKIAVTGASGFVGRHVVAELERRGLRPVLLLRANKPAPAFFVGRTILPLELERFEAGSVFDGAGAPDVLIHLAWSGLDNFRSLSHFESEAPSHYAFLRAMVDGGLPSLLTTGTCLEYGLQSGALNEAADTRPVCAYGLAKDTLRRQLDLLGRVKPFALTWARLFYLHGEGQSERALWPSLQRAAKAGDTRFPMSAGEQLRDYLPVTVAARYLVDLALAPSPPSGHGVVNVCAGTPVSVRGLVESWIAANAWPIRPALGAKPYADYEPMAFWGDRTKLDAALAAGPPTNTQSDPGAQR
jgi:nucleoside-diphosphate-sugar epimerase